MITFTHAYAAPELIDSSVRSVADEGSDPNRVRVGITEVQPTLDIYPLGVMLFQALDPGLSLSAGMEKFDCASRLVTTSDLRAIVRRALASDPKVRFQTARDFEVALRNAVRSATEEWIHN